MPRSATALPSTTRSSHPQRRVSFRSGDFRNEDYASNQHQAVLLLGTLQGGAFKIVGASPQLINVTLLSNDAFFAGGLYSEVCRLFAFASEARRAH